MAREFLSKECPKPKIKELEKEGKCYNPETWRNMADLGWMGLVLPDQYGGGNADFMDLVVLFEEIGRNILPGPFFSTIALGALPLMDFASTDQKAKYLPAIASGEQIWTLAINEMPPDFDPSISAPRPPRMDQGAQIAAVSYQGIIGSWIRLEWTSSQALVSAEGSHPVPMAGQGTTSRGPAPYNPGSRRRGSALRGRCPSPRTPRSSRSS